MTIKYRNLYVQCLLFIVTFALYSIYWFYVTCREMEEQLGREEPVFLWTILFILFPLPFCWYSCYKQGELFEQLSPDMNRWILFSLWLSFPPAVWMIVQYKLNKMALAQPVQPAAITPA